MSRNLLLLAAAFAAGTGLLGATTAKANPVYLGYCQNAACSAPTEIGNSGANGSAGTSGAVLSSNSNFYIQMSATGSPIYAEPTFNSNTITVTSAGAGTIYLYASETGLSASVPSFITGFSNNSGSNVSVTETSYAGASTKFSTDYQLSTSLVTPGTSASEMTAARPSGLGSTYAITEVYAITFTAAGQTVNATMSMRGGAVPEPASLALLGSALAGLGFVRLRKKAAVAAA